MIWNIATRAVERVLHDSGPALFTVKFAPNGTLVAAGGPEDTIEVWDIGRPKGSELIKTLPLIGGAARLAFKHDGSVLAAGSDARYISIWSVGSWKKIFQLDSQAGQRSVYGFSPTSGDMAFDGEEGLVRILHARRPVAGAAESGILSGMDVFFDRLAPPVSENAGGATKIEFKSCAAASQQAAPGPSPVTSKSD